MVEIDRDKCAATVKISSQNVIHKTVNLNDILSVKNVSLNPIYISWVIKLLNLIYNIKSQKMYLYQIFVWPNYLCVNLRISVC